MRDLAAAGAGQGSPLLAGRDEVRSTAYVVISADRGLCGGYNAGVQRAAEGEVKADVLAGKQYQVIPVGRKAEAYFRFRGYTLGQGFAGFSDSPTHADAKRIGAHVVGLFTSGEVDRVELVYTRFVSAGNQEVVLRPLVPAVGRDRCRWRRQGGRCRGPDRRLRVRARPDDDPRDCCCRATSRRACTPPCSTPRRPSTPSASGR